MSGIEVKEFSTRSAATRSRFSVLEHRSIAIAPPNDLPNTIIYMENISMRFCYQCDEFALF